RWEKRILEKASAVITVADTIAEEHKKHNDNVFVVSNFPTKIESSLIPPLSQPKDHLEIVLVTKYSSPAEIRSTDRYIQSISKTEAKLTVIGNVEKKAPDVEYLGFIPHNEISKLLSRFHIGLHTMPQDKMDVGYFRYSSPNRVFLYAHAGIMPFVHRKMIYIQKILQDFVFTADSEKDIRNIIDSKSNDTEFLNRNPKKVQGFAQKQLVFEDYQKVIDRAYSK
ncbi:MAG: hypothetical protein ACTSRU_13885, partial [Candidatus Hodarchaeales archaeon]